VCRLQNGMKMPKNDNYQMARITRIFRKVALCFISDVVFFTRNKLELENWM